MSLAEYPPLGKQGGKGKKPRKQQPVPAVHAADSRSSDALAAWRQGAEGSEAKDSYLKGYLQELERLRAPSTSSSSGGKASGDSGAGPESVRSQILTLEVLTNSTVELAERFPSVAPDAIFALLAVIYPDFGAAAAVLADSVTSMREGRGEEGGNPGASVASSSTTSTSTSSQAVEKSEEEAWTAAWLAAASPTAAAGSLHGGGRQAVGSAGKSTGGPGRRGGGTGSGAPSTVASRTPSPALHSREEQELNDMAIAQAIADHDSAASARAKAARDAEEREGAATAAALVAASSAGGKGAGAVWGKASQSGVGSATPAGAVAAGRPPGAGSAGGANAWGGAGYRSSASSSSASLPSLSSRTQAQGAGRGAGAAAWPALSGGGRGGGLGAPSVDAGLGNKGGIAASAGGPGEGRAAPSFGGVGLGMAAVRMPGVTAMSQQSLFGGGGGGGSVETGGVGAGKGAMGAALAAPVASRGLAGRLQSQRHQQQVHQIQQLRGMMSSAGAGAGVGAGKPEGLAHKPSVSPAPSPSPSSSPAPAPASAAAAGKAKAIPLSTAATAFPPAAPSRAWMGGAARTLRDRLYIDKLSASFPQLDERLLADTYYDVGRNEEWALARLVELFPDMYEGPLKGVVAAATGVGCARAGTKGDGECGNPERKAPAGPSAGAGDAGDGSSDEDSDSSNDDDDGDDVDDDEDAIGRGRAGGVNGGRAYTAVSIEASAIDISDTAMQQWLPVRGSGDVDDGDVVAALCLALTGLVTPLSSSPSAASSASATTGGLARGSNQATEASLSAVRAREEYFAALTRKLHRESRRVFSRRNDILRAAAANYARKQGAMAAELSERASALTSRLHRLEVWRMAAAFSSRNPTRVIAGVVVGVDARLRCDLHGQNCEAAVRLARLMVRRFRGGGAAPVESIGAGAGAGTGAGGAGMGLRRRRELVLVVGSGTHSKDGIEKIRPAVISYLEGAKLPYTAVGPAIHVRL